MPVGDYLVGVVFFAGVWGCAAGVATIVQLRRLGHLTGAYAALSWSLLFLGVLILVHLLPGMLGILTRGTVLAAAVVGLLLSLLVRQAPEESPVEPFPEALWRDPPGWRWVAFGAAALVGVNVLGAFEELATQAPAHVDALSFGLPGVAHWLRTGSIWDTGAFLRLFQIRTYPNTGDVLTLASILPWRNDAFIRFPEPALLGLTGVAVYTLGRELRASWVAAALMAATVLSVRALTLPALLQIKPDVFMYFTFASGCAFLLRYLRTSRRSNLLLGGLGLGLSFGSRWYGISSVVAVLAVWALGGLIARRGLRQVGTDTAVLAGVVLAAGGVWLIRNLALTGNPLYPVKVAPLGVTIFDAPRDIITEKLGFTIVDRLNQPGVWRHYILPDYAHAIGLPGAVMLVGILTALALALFARRPGEGDLGVVTGVAVAALLLACTYAVTPASTQGFKSAPLKGFVGANARWLVPAMLLAAPVTARSWGALGRWRPLAYLLAAGAVLAGVDQTFSVSAKRLGAVALALAAITALVRWVARRQASWRRPARIAAAGAAGCVLLGAVAVGQADQHRYNEKRFAGRSAVVDWVVANAPQGHEVGIVGGWPGDAFVPTYGMFGPRLRNDVSYLGPIRRGQVKEYRSGGEFRRAIERRHVDLLVVGRVGTPNLDHSAPLKVARNPLQARWAEAVGFRQVAEDRYFVLLARGVNGRA